MSKGDIVWSSQGGDQRKQKVKSDHNDINLDDLLLKLRRLTSGKGRAVIEISSLPANKDWCQDLARELKKKCGVGGTYKNDVIELHLDDHLKVAKHLEQKNIKWKKIGG